MKYILLILMIMLLAGCDRESAWDCIQKGGKEVRVDYEFDNLITEVRVFDDINIELVNANGSPQRFTIVSGKNLVPEIKLESMDGSLTMRNFNNCRWARPANNVKVIISTDTLHLIEKRGYGEIKSSDPLRFSFRVHTYVAGDLDLVVDNLQMGFELNALNNLTLSGKTHVTGFYMGIGKDGMIHAENLEADEINIVHDGYNGVHVSARQQLTYYIWNSGNIYLHNEPESIIEIERKGTGQLVRLF